MGATRRNDSHNARKLVRLAKKQRNQITDMYRHHGDLFQREIDDWGVFKNGSRRREEAVFSAKHTSASLPRRLRLLRRFLNSSCAATRKPRFSFTFIGIRVIGA